MNQVKRVSEIKQVAIDVLAKLATRNKKYHNEISALLEELKVLSIYDLIDLDYDSLFASLHFMDIKELESVYDSIINFLTNSHELKINSKEKLKSELKWSQKFSNELMIEQVLSKYRK